MAKITNGFAIAALFACATITSGCIPPFCKKETPKKEVVTAPEEDSLAQAEIPANVAQADASADVKVEDAAVEQKA